MAIEEITKLVEESVTSEVFGVWFLIGAALVFFMQAGFAMVETGFTRAKNAGNIIMKNLMDFCIGTVVFVLLGFSLMMAEDYVLGIFGVPNLEILTVATIACAFNASIWYSGGISAGNTPFMYSLVSNSLIWPVEEILSLILSFTSFTFNVVSLPFCSIIFSLYMFCTLSLPILSLSNLFV